MKFAAVLTWDLYEGARAAFHAPSTCITFTTFEDLIGFSHSNAMTRACSHIYPLDLLASGKWEESKSPPAYIQHVHAAGGKGSSSWKSPPPCRVKQSGLVRLQLRAVWLGFFPGPLYHRHRP